MELATGLPSRCSASFCTHTPSITPTPAGLSSLHLTRSGSLNPHAKQQGEQNLMELGQPQHVGSWASGATMPLPQLTPSAGPEADSLERLWGW